MIAGIATFATIAAVAASPFGILALGGEAAGPGGELILPFVLSFLGISLAVAVVTSAIAIGAPRPVARESVRFFISIVVGITLFSLIVGALQWIFIGPLA